MESKENKNIRKPTLVPLVLTGFILFGSAGVVYNLESARHHFITKPTEKKIYYTIKQDLPQKIKDLRISFKNNDDDEEIVKKLKELLYLRESIEDKFSIFAGRAYFYEGIDKFMEPLITFLYDTCDYKKPKDYPCSVSNQQFQKELDKVLKLIEFKLQNYQSYESGSLEDYYLRWKKR